MSSSSSSSSSTSSTASRPLIAVIGSTGCGKTQLAVAAARALGACQVLNVDAMQMYAGFDVATNKPTATERAGVRHRMLGSLPAATLHYRVG